MPKHEMNESSAAKFGDRTAPLSGAPLNNEVKGQNMNITNTAPAATLAERLTLGERLEAALGGLEATGCNLSAENGEALLSQVGDREQAAAELRELANIIEAYDRVEGEAA